MTRLSVIALFALGAFAAAGCNDSPTAPDDTADATSPSANVIVFEGVLEPKGARFYSFRTSQTASVKATLQSLTRIGQRDAAAMPVRLGVGVPRGEGCAMSESIDTSPGLVTQFSSSSLAAGTYCINVADTGHLLSAMQFLIRFSHS